MSYRDEVLRTAGDVSLLNGALGLAGETGEVVEIIKKHLCHGQELNQLKLIKELGDVRWYLELLCVAGGTTMEEVEYANVSKLRARYPEGFSPAASEARVDLKVNECGAV